MYAMALLSGLCGKAGEEGPEQTTRLPIRGGVSLKDELVRFF